MTYYYSLCVFFLIVYYEIKPASPWLVTFQNICLTMLVVIFYTSYTSRGALAGTRNSSMGPPHEGSIR